MQGGVGSPKKVLRGGSGNRLVKTDGEGLLAESDIAVDAVGFTASSTVLWNDAKLDAANTWTDVDIATIVSISAVPMLVCIEITCTSFGGGSFLCVKPKGQGGVFAKHYSTSTTTGMGGHWAYTDVVDEVWYATLVTDSNGVIQIGCNRSVDNHRYTIKLLGYIG